jgi:hypothetical protein
VALGGARHLDRFGDHAGRPDFQRPDDFISTYRGLLFDAQKGFASVVDCTQAKEFALAHWLVKGADRGHLFVRRFDSSGTVRENVASDVLASLTTMVWNAPSKSWTGGAAMADASLNRRMTVRLGDAVAFAQIGIVGLDGQIELEALRPYGVHEVRPPLRLGRGTSVGPRRTPAGLSSGDLRGRVRRGGEHLPRLGRPPWTASVRRYRSGVPLTMTR